MQGQNRNNNNHRIEQIKAMLQQSPNDCFLLHALGLEYSKLGSFEQARQTFEAVLQADAQYVGTYYHLAKTLEHLAMRNEAISVYESGIKIAMAQKNMHAASELRSALEQLTEDDD